MLSYSRQTRRARGDMMAFIHWRWMVLLVFITGCVGETERSTTTPDPGLSDSAVTDAARPRADQGQARPDAELDAGRPVDARPPRQDAMPRLDGGMSVDVGMAAIDATAMDALPANDAERPIDAASPMDMGGADAHLAPSPCPAREYGDDCAFGQTSRMTRDLAHLDVVEIARVRRPEELTPLQGAQLLRGFACDGIFMPADLDEAFQRIDQDEVRVLVIDRLDTGERFDWIRIFMGDTEVGHMFRAGTLDLVAYVSDGDVLGCTVLRAPPAQLTCPELHACLANCDLDDIECRRPCIRATEEDALQMYVDLDECANECGEDLQCLNRICSEEWEACFGEPPPAP